MWYIKYNGTILPTPYRTHCDCLNAIRELQATLGPGIYEPVNIQ